MFPEVLSSTGLLFRQQFIVDLVHARLRQRIQEDHRFGQLELRQSLAAKVE